MFFQLTFQCFICDCSSIVWIGVFKHCGGEIVDLKRHVTFFTACCLSVKTNFLVSLIEKLSLIGMKWLTTYHSCRFDYFLIIYDIIHSVCVHRKQQNTVISNAQMANIIKIRIHTRTFTFSYLHECITWLSENCMPFSSMHALITCCSSRFWIKPSPRSE